METVPRADFLLGVTCDPKAETFSILSRGVDGKPYNLSFDSALHGALVTGLHAIAPVVGQVTTGQAPTVTGVNLLTTPDQTLILQVQIDQGPVLLLRLENETFARLRHIVLGQ
jgi:hypothetical protein